VVQVPGPALRLTAPAFRGALTQSVALRQGVHRYTQVLLVQTAQGAVRNRHGVRHDGPLDAESLTLAIERAATVPTGGYR
jgi:hypothetical protein